MKIILVYFLFAFGGSAMANGSSMAPEDFFNRVNYGNMEQLCSEFYAEDVEFQDPVGRVSGLTNLIKYYKHMYENVVSISFKPINNFVKGDERIFVWQMDLRHKRLRGGEPIVLDGISTFKYRDGKVIYHRDYFDLGEMIYENIPVFGTLIKWIKDKAHGESP
jgi:limonene-1,2-epoxide hydrolase